MLKNKFILTLAVLAFSLKSLYAQQDTNHFELPHFPYSEYHYDSSLYFNFMWYNYSGLWDFNGDGQKDSLYFIGNNGVHTRFHLRIILSSDLKVRDFPTVNLDMPWLWTKEKFDELGKNLIIQLVVYDFDSDGLPDIYLNFNDSGGYSHIPWKWRLKGVRTMHILMQFKGNRMKVRDYIFQLQ